MSEILGPMTILQRALPGGVDGSEIAKWQMQDGTTFGQFIQQAALALGDLNQELMQRWGPVGGVTEEQFFEYVQGGGVTPLNRITDVDDPDEVHGATIGHMLPLEAYGGRVGGTRRYFRDSRTAQIRSTISTIVNRGRWRFELDTLSRLFTDTEHQIGGSGYNVPLVRTGGTISFIPPAWGGKAFDNTHTHFLGFNSSTSGVTLGSMITGLVKTIEEHGHQAPYEALVSRADVADYQELKQKDAKFVEFVAPVVQVIDRGGDTANAAFFATGQAEVSLGGIFGYLQTPYGQVNLRSSARVPTGYAAVWKSYGSNDQRNPVAWRVHPNEGFGLYIVPETTSDAQYPIKRLSIEMDLGVGIGMDRTNGAVGLLVAGGSWTNPTIT
jgi:hypothetical protein